MATTAHELHSGPGSVPVPDPTALTTQQMLRETEGIRELVFREILALEKSLSTRIDAIDRATLLMHENMTRFPTELDKRITHLKELHQEKFESIASQFRERDTRTEQNAKDTKVAVDAALQAAEKAVGKQQESFALATSKAEATVTKQIDQQGQLISSTTKALDDKIGDLKERLTRIEGTGVGRSAGSQAVVAWIVAGFAVASAIVTIAIALLKFKGP